ncbi:hypothetical protein [Massilia sp. CCM 8734]|uniref:hypothetical protein n=1 Tax=Massilia sp. CCM 8734 TaxID=2609283 RepID=UPI0014217166|nr:hypothetical protein [Massilia sp. CCM 8734]NHZ94613.1 hypothetical protein [Massilia sp. CCM 8734]
MNTQNDLANAALVKVRDYKLHSALYQANGFLSYPQYQQFVRGVLDEYFANTPSIEQLTTVTPKNEQ